MTSSAGATTPVFACGSNRPSAFGNKGRGEAIPRGSFLTVVQRGELLRLTAQNANGDRPQEPMSEGSALVPRALEPIDQWPKSGTSG